MELPSLDKQCNEKDCKQLDFLPLECKCGKIFCSHHFNIHVQLCEKSRFLQEEELKKIEDIFVCSHGGCKERSVVPIICDRCKKNFCVRHRHLLECEEKSADTVAAEKEKYAAPVRLFNEAKATVDKELENKLTEAKNKGKNKDMACKVQLMKIKSKAVGLKTVPVPDRLYFNVTHPKKESGKTTAVFVSKRWTLGRAIDAIAQELKLQNNNNKVNEKKLRLFKKDGNDILSSNMSVGLNTLLENNSVVNGEDLIIEYVDNNCVSLTL